MSRPKPLVRRHPRRHERKLLDRHNWATFMSRVWLRIDGPGCDIGKRTAFRRENLTRGRVLRAMTRYHRRTRP